MIEGVEYFKADYIKDNRGYLSKKFSSSNARLRPFDLREVFITSSKKGVIRGMHLQTGTSANWRFINILRGALYDVLLDLRKESSTYLEHRVQILEPGRVESVLVPPGVAHGFQALEESQILYLTSTEYNPELDFGVNMNSLKIDFPLAVTAQSDRDMNLPKLSDFI
jgi:dTDP-4-dehydrorhamnose 3,5-epimerase